MKISTKQYAQTLFELTQEKSEIEVDGVIKRFAELLKKNKQLKRITDIIKKFSEIYNKENGIIEVEMATARELESEQTNKIKSFLKEKYSVKEVLLKSKIDEKTKGGIIIRVEDEILDGSISRQLRELEKMLKN